MRLLGTVQSVEDGYIEHWKGTSVTSAKPLLDGVVTCGYTTGRFPGARLLGSARPVGLNDYDGFASFVDKDTGAVRWMTSISFTKQHHIPWGMAVGPSAVYISGMMYVGEDVSSIGGGSALKMLTMVMKSVGFVVGLDAKDGALLWNVPLEGPVGAISANDAGTVIYAGGRAKFNSTTTAA
eukprot:gene4960-49236_t